MLFIHEQLRNSQYPNCPKLSRELEVKAIRTILRDIEFMRDQLSLPIDYDKQRRGYYYTRPVEPFPGVGVSESELFALLVAQKAVAQYKGTSFHEPLRTAFEKLTADLDPKVVVHLRDLGAALEIPLTELPGGEVRIAFHLQTHQTQGRPGTEGTGCLRPAKSS